MRNKIPVQAGTTANAAPARPLPPSVFPAPPLVTLTAAEPEARTAAAAPAVKPVVPPDAHSRALPFTLMPGCVWLGVPWVWGGRLATPSVTVPPPCAPGVTWVGNR